MKKNATAQKSTRKSKQSAQPFRMCVASLNAYLNSYITALEATSARR